MEKEPPPADRAKPPKPDARAEREAKLAEQLRRNLQRRKTKARALKQSEKSDPGKAASSD